MNLELLPSGKFNTNKLILNLATIAFNMLRLIGQKALELRYENNKKEPRIRLRLKTVLLNFIQIACKYIKHANTTCAVFGKNYIYYDTFEKILKRYG